MNLPAFCIKRPAFTIVISLIMIIVGLIGFSRLPVRWVPNVNPPQVSIVTNYPGANARLVERDVTKIIESALSGINGIESMSSTTRRDESYISITFKLGNNMDAAVEDVRTAVERVRDELPKDARNPTVLKANPNGGAIMYLSYYDEHRSERELSDYVDKIIVPLFETIDGVGSVQVYGKRISAVKVLLDPARMAGANVTVDEVTQLLQDQNSSAPSGQIRGFDRFYSIVTDTSVKSIEQFNELIIRDNQNNVVRLKDIGEAKIEPEDTDSVFRINGKSAIALGIVPQSTANPLDVEQAVKKVFASAKRSLPAGMQSDIIYNQADYIRASIHSVYESFIEAIIFVWLVILAFLCSFRATLVPIITIPVCLISTFAILFFFGFSINTITLMAFVLAIGLVVDDAIVMLENISRHMESGLSAFSAALKGSKEIIFPIIAMTLTLVAVYAPIAFTPGLLGVLFREFTFTLAGAVLISGIVALTLSPMMCARILKVDHKQRANRYATWLMEKFTWLQSKYENILHYLLEKRTWVVAGLLIVTAIGFTAYHYLESELAPAEDMGEVYVSVSAPHSASYQYTDSYTRQLEPIFSKIPEVDSYLSMMYQQSHSFQLLTLKPKNQRKQSVAEMIAGLTEQVSSIPGVRVNVFPPMSPLAQFVGGDDGDNVGMVIMTTSDYSKLQKSAQHLMDVIKQNPGFAHVDHKLKWDSEQFQLNVDRNKAADLKVPIANITRTISTLMAEELSEKPMISILLCR